MNMRTFRLRDSAFGIIIAALFLSLSCSKNASLSEPEPQAAPSEKLGVADQQIADFEQVLLRMIGRDYTVSGRPIFMRDSTRVLAGGSIIDAPEETGQLDPTIRWRLQVAVPAAQPEEFTSWSFIEGRWPERLSQEDDYAYAFVAIEFFNLATELISKESQLVISQRSFQIAKTCREEGRNKGKSELIDGGNGYSFQIEYHYEPGVFDSITILFASTALLAKPEDFSDQ